MDKEHIQAAATYPKGAIEEAVGKATGGDAKAQRAVQRAKASDGANEKRSPAELHADGPMH